MNLSIANVWSEAGATVTGVIAAALAVQPLLSGSPPQGWAGWTAFVVAVGGAILKTFGK